MRLTRQYDLPAIPGCHPQLACSTYIQLLQDPVTEERQVSTFNDKKKLLASRGCAILVYMNMELRGKGTASVGDRVQDLRKEEKAPSMGRCCDQGQSERSSQNEHELLEVKTEKKDW